MTKRRSALRILSAALVAVGAAVMGRVVVRLIGAEGGDRSAADRPFGVLAGHTYASLTTFRKNGEAVSTPVWFAVLDDRVYVGTDPESGKMKRIRNDPRVVLRVSDPWGRTRGASVEGIAHPIEGDAPAEVWRALFGKYRLELGMAHLFGALPWYRPTLEIRSAEPGP